MSLSLGMLHAKNMMGITEDELIVRGILYDEYKAYENSYQVYKKLFDETGAEVYLFKEATSSLLARKHIIESIDRLKKWDAIHPHNVEVRRLLIPLYLTVRQVKMQKLRQSFYLNSPLHRWTWI